MPKSFRPGYLSVERHGNLVHNNKVFRGITVYPPPGKGQGCGGWEAPIMPAVSQSPFGVRYVEWPSGNVSRQQFCSRPNVG